MSDDKKQDSIEERYAKASDYLKRYSHSSRKLYQSILKALPSLQVNDQYSEDNIDLAIKAGKILDLLGEASRTWNISIHWLFTVCNPKITDQSNPIKLVIVGLTMPKSLMEPLRHALRDMHVIACQFRNR